MSLNLKIASIQMASLLLANGGIDEVLAVLPRSETDDSGMFRWPETSLPRTHVEISDLGCGQLYSDQTIAEILVDHPDMIAPSDANVQAIVDYGRDLVDRSRTSDITCLIHCHGGVSRSVAAAFVILAIEAGPGNERLSADRLCAINPDPMPNANIVFIADRLLGRGGRLFAEWERIRTESRYHPIDPNDIL